LDEDDELDDEELLDEELELELDELELELELEELEEEPELLELLELSPSAQLTVLVSDPPAVIVTGYPMLSAVDPEPSLRCHAEAKLSEMGLPLVGKLLTGFMAVPL
jgi:hypothetical protein